MKMKEPYLMSTNPLKGFNPSMDVVGGVLEWDNKILLVYRHKDKPCGETWGIPSGKLEKNEPPILGLIREINEEVGILLNENSIHSIENFYIRRDNIEFIYRMYRSQLEAFPKIILSLEENTMCRWVTIDEALEMNLIIGGIEVLSYYKKTRYTLRESNQPMYNL